MNCLLLQLITFISVSKRQTQSRANVGPVGHIGDGFVVTFPFRQFGEWYSIFSSRKGEEWPHGFSGFSRLPFLWLCGLGGKVPNQCTVREEDREERLEKLPEQPSGSTWTEGFPKMQKGRIPGKREGALAFPAWGTSYSFHELILKPENRFLEARRGNF